MQTYGSISPSSHYTEFDFETYNGAIYFPVINNTYHTKNFFFDTGAELTVLHKENITGKPKRLTGASNKSIKVGSEIIPFFKINDVVFKDIYTLNTNLNELNEYVNNFGGIIGQSMIRKSNWLIDFPNKKMKVSNRNLTDNSFQFFKVQLMDGSPFAFVTINNRTYNFLIDLGSNTTVTIPSNSRLASDLLKKYDFEDGERNLVSLGDNRTVSEKVGVLPSMQIDQIDFSNVKVRIFPTSHARLGVNFFKNYTLYIDNSYRGMYGLKETQ